MLQTRITLALAAVCLWGSGCTSDPSPRLVVTADWLNQSLTLFDFDKLTDGESEATVARVGIVDLSAYSPGPLEVELTPDGKTALVTISPGFFGSGVTNVLVGSPEVADDGTLLIVDLVTRQIVADIDTAQVPMGIAISNDGTVAYTANYGTDSVAGETMSIIDIVGRRLVKNVVVGRRPEQVTLSADGTLGAINLAGDDGILVFETSDAENTLSPLVATGNDPSGLAFLSSTRLLVANSQSNDLTLIDTSTPGSPVVVSSAASGVSVPYGVTYSSSNGLAYVSGGLGAPTGFVEVANDTDVLSVSPMNALEGGAFPLTIAIDQDARFAFVPHMIDSKLTILDLSTREQRGFSWLSEPGPSYVAIQRSR